jgi:hypothetical protein
MGLIFKKNYEHIDFFDFYAFTDYNHLILVFFLQDFLNTLLIVRERLDFLNESELEEDFLETI